MPDSHRTPAPPLTLAATLAGELGRQRRALGAAGPQFKIADLSHVEISGRIDLVAMAAAVLQAKP
jgi:hypothetical protein